jgi:predicted RNA-binding protein with PIN domain
MSVIFLIDAYNLILSDERMAAGTLQQQRERLLRFLEERRPGGNNPVVVVFDGKPGRDWSGWRGPTQIVFSEERDADTEIKDRIDAMSNAAAATVVTNDRAIQKWVRGAGARVVGCADFLRAGFARKPAARSQKLDDLAAAEINEQMKRIWKIK